MNFIKLHRMRFVVFVLLLLFFVACYISRGLFSSHTASSHAAHVHVHDRPSEADIMRVSAVNRGAQEAAKPCRQGAFMQASSILNSVVDIQRSLPAATTSLTRSELDTVLYTALIQARSEVHCVAGVLSHGYDKSFAQSIQRATQLAKSRGLPADVVRTGEELVSILSANQPVAEQSKP